MGHLYYIDKKGNISRTRMNQLGKKKTELVVKTNIKRVKGYLYFLNKKGDICATQLNRKGAPKKKKKDSRRKKKNQKQKSINQAYPFRGTEGLN